MNVPLFFSSATEPFNWSNITGDWMSWITTGYTNVLGSWFWPLVFVGIVGYVYAVHKSAIAAAAAILLAFGIFGITGIFAGVAQFSYLFQTITVISFSALFVTLFTMRKKSKG